MDRALNLIGRLAHSAYALVRVRIRLEAFLNVPSSLPFLLKLLFAPNPFLLKQMLSQYVHIYVSYCFASTKASPSHKGQCSDAAGGGRAALYHMPPTIIQPARY